MYIIRNISKGKVLLGDLGISLDLNESTDLDKRNLTREQIRNSRNLLVAKEKHKVEEGKVDPLDITPDILAEMERRLREQITSQLAQNASTVSAPPLAPLPVQDNQPLDDLHSKMDLILKALAAGVNKPVQQADESMDSEPDDDKMLDIHRRAVNRITQGTSGKIESKSEVTENKNLDKNVDELGDFI